MPTFSGMLRTNSIFSGIFNMIISQQTFSDNIKGTFSSLVDRARVDGTLLGDTKLYYSTTALPVRKWVQDSPEALNVLEPHRPPSPKCQAIILDQFYEIALTIDDYTSKQAWGSEGAFSEFTSVMTGWINETKRIYEATTYNVYIGTAISEAPKNIVHIDTVEGASGLSTLDAAKLEAMNIAHGLADLFIEMSDVSGNFNDYGYLRSYDMNDIVVVWNSKWVNKIRKIDLPTIFHQEGLMDKFDETVLPSRYFGTVNAVATQGNENETVCSRYNQYIGQNYYKAGDPIKVGDTAPAGTSYTIDDTIICKILTKLPPFMSSMEVSSDFYNARNKSDTIFFTGGHNTIEYLKDKPLITVQQS